MDSACGVMHTRTHSEQGTVVRPKYAHARMHKHTQEEGRPILLGTQ